MVFPLGDDNSDRTSFPIVTVTLIVPNVLVFAVFQGMGGNERLHDGLRHRACRNHDGQ